MKQIKNAAWEFQLLAKSCMISNIVFERLVAQNAKTAEEKEEESDKQLGGGIRFFLHFF